MWAARARVDAGREAHERQRSRARTLPCRVERVCFRSVEGVTVRVRRRFAFRWRVTMEGRLEVADMRRTG